MLKTEIKEPTARAIAAALSRNEEFLTTYDSHLRLAEKLINALAWDDLRELAVALKEERVPILPMRPGEQNRSGRKIPGIPLANNCSK